ncbi:MAG: sugar phosphate isomerase/epimerase [archaeon GB-1867-035]|nr:sugar phosphate isomerase/epimerase [Candidatus Culexmicrobium profundum]
MKFKVGVSTLFTMNRSIDFLINHIDNELVQLWEFVDDGLHFLQDKEDKLRALSRKARDLDLVLSMHAPYAAVNLSATNPVLRRCNHNITLSCIEHARKLDCKYIVFHPGLRDPFTFLFSDLDEPINESIEFLLKVGDLCSDYGIVPLLENLSTLRATIISPSDFKSFFKLASNFRMVLDIPHSLLTGLFDDYLKHLSEKIVYFHISDNNGKRDLHWGLSRGSLNWRQALEKILGKGLSGPLIIENITLSDVKLSLTALDHFLS